MAKGRRHKFLLGGLGARWAKRTIVIAESLARVIAAIRVTNVHWWPHFPPNAKTGPHRPCVRCAAIRIARLAFVRVAFVPLGVAEWPANLDSFSER